MKISRRSLMKSAAVLPAALGGAGEVMAQQAQYTPDDLKSTLTPFGGLRAGNAEGTIPAWTGELIPYPADYVSGEARPDPFAGDAPLFKINGQNYTQYQDKLSQGDIYLLKTYPDYELVIYPTRRTAIAPQYFYDYTYKNASTAHLSPDGNNLYGAYGGVPFPIPTNGKQILWNHEVRWRGVAIADSNSNYQVTSSGEVILRSTATLQSQYPYVFEGREADFNGIAEQIFIVDTAPAYVEGEAVLILYPLDPLIHPTRGWEYELGERRVRLAPQLQYDTPVDVAGGVINWDEGEMLGGPLDQYDCRIIGKKEMYIPYNCTRAVQSRVSEKLGPHHINTGIYRWELHRVWVVERTLAPGKRNVDTRRICYVDEDTWLLVSMDVYDANNELWKYHHAVPMLRSDVPLVGTGLNFIAYDFTSQEYVAFGEYDGGKGYKPIPIIPASFYTPGQLAASAGGS